MGHDIGLTYDGDKYDKFVWDNNDDISVNSASHDLLDKCLDSFYLPAKLDGVTVVDSLELLNNGLVIIEEHKDDVKYDIVKEILTRMLYWAGNCPEATWYVT